MDLVPLPIQSRPSANVDHFICHIQKVRDKVQHNIVASNESYKQCVDVRYRFVNFQKVTWLWSEFFLNGYPLDA